MGEKVLDTKAIRKYWRDVLQRAFKPTWSNIGMRTLILLLSFSLFVWFLSGIGSLIDWIPLWFVEDRLAEVNYGIASIVGSLSLFLILFLAYFWRTPAEMHYEQEKMIEYLSPKNLDLFVEYGANINKDAGGGIPKTTLTVDVVNTGNRKILDLEAHFASIDQVTENMPDDWSTTKAYLSYRKKRLEWENGNNAIDLKPGFPETKLKIAVLDCSVSQFRFVHEGVSALLKDLQENGLYKILIKFRGREEGDDQEYKFFDCEVRFLCLPKNCVLEHITENTDVRVVPEGMREKINPLRNYI